MFVTGIEEYKNNKYKIYLNNEFAFVLYKGELHKYNISIGNELDDAIMHEIIDVLLLKRAKLRAMNLLKSRDYTEKSLRSKLAEGLYPVEVVDKALEYVKSYGYVDDLRYAESYVRCHKDTRSTNEIKRKLLEKGVASDVIMVALEEEGANPDEELDLAISLIRKKCKHPEELDYTGRNKLYGYMYRKGYSIDIVDRALAKICIVL